MDISQFTAADVKAALLELTNPHMDIQALKQNSRFAELFVEDKELFRIVMTMKVAIMHQCAGDFDVFYFTAICMAMRAGVAMLQRKNDLRELEKLG